MRLISAASTNTPAASPPSLSSFDYATLSLTACLLLLSSLSLLLLALLQRRPHLSPFTPLSPSRLTLVSLVSVWSLHHILRFSFFSPSDLACKTHVILSLGVFEPAFLLSFLSLLKLSVKKHISLFWSVAAPLLPSFCLQVFFVAVFPSQGYSRRFPSVFLLSSERTEERSVRCSFPLSGTMVFAAFFVFYCLAFLVTYWRAINLVINKGTRARIHVLALSVFVCVCLQLLLMTLSTFWRLDDVAYGFVEVGMFLVPAVCAMFGEGILVIKPIMDALGADNSGRRGA